MSENNFLDAFPYPWHIAEAQQFHDLLVKRFPRVDEIFDICKETCGIERYEINTDQASVFVWKDILDAAAGRCTTRKLAQYMEKASMPIADNLAEEMQTFDIEVEVPLFLRFTVKGPDDETAFRSVITRLKNLKFEVYTHARTAEMLGVTDKQGHPATDIKLSSSEPSDGSISVDAQSSHD